jgi:hypothetical protein
MSIRVGGCSSIERLLKMRAELDFWFDLTDDDEFEAVDDDDEKVGDAFSVRLFGAKYLLVIGIIYHLYQS